MAEDLTGWATPTQVSEPAPAEPPPIAERPPSAYEKVLRYEAGQAYKIDVGLNAPLDLILEPGEVCRNIAGPSFEGEDSAPWQIKEGDSEAGAQAKHHIFISANKPGQTMGLVVTTNRRTMYLTMRSVTKTNTRAVRWSYAEQPSVVSKPKVALLPDTSTPQRYHVGYLIEPGQPRPVWTPRQTLDNGRQTFVVFPPTVLAGQAPMVRAIGPHGPALINARLVGAVLVLDQIPDRLELRLGIGPTAELVTITRQVPVTINCPGADQCPSWPMIYAERE
jgi:type IV secretion system protein VirB9